MPSVSETIAEVLNRPLVFVHGKGGVGKTVVSQAIASTLARKNLQKNFKILWITLEDPTRPPGQLIEVTPHLWHLNCDFLQSFEEYAAMKIGVTSLTRIFLKNKLIRYLAKAAPGIHELVLLGKIWFERENYSHVIVDLPSTGYGLAMFQSTSNFIQLFHGGPLHRDAQAMLKTFEDPKATGHLIVSLPEEMPLRESIELNDHLNKMFPKNPRAFFVNRVFPSIPETQNEIPPPQSWSNPLPLSAQDYVQKRARLEEYNLRIWREAQISFGKIDFVPHFESLSLIVKGISDQFQSEAYL